MLNFIKLFWNFLFTWLITCTSYRGAFAPKNKNDLCTMKGICLILDIAQWSDEFSLKLLNLIFPPPKKKKKWAQIDLFLSDIKAIFSIFSPFFSVEYDLSLTQCPSQSEIVPWFLGARAPLGIARVKKKKQLKEKVSHVSTCTIIRDSPRLFQIVPDSLI